MQQEFPNQVASTWAGMLSFSSWLHVEGKEGHSKSARKELIMRNLVEPKRTAAARLGQHRQETGVLWGVGPWHLGAPVPSHQVRAPLTQQPQLPTPVVLAEELCSFSPDAVLYQHHRLHPVCTSPGLPSTSDLLCKSVTNQTIKKYKHYYPLGGQFGNTHQNSKRTISLTQRYLAVPTPR